MLESILGKGQGCATCANLRMIDEVSAALGMQVPHGYCAALTEDPTAQRVDTGTPRTATEVNFRSKKCVVDIGPPRRRRRAYRARGRR